jgi:hypothetical protein
VIRIEFLMNNNSMPSLLKEYLKKDIKASGVAQWPSRYKALGSIPSMA